MRGQVPEESPVPAHTGVRQHEGRPRLPRGSTTLSKVSEQSQEDGSGELQRGHGESFRR